MMKKLIVVILLSVPATNLFAQFGLYASAAYINQNGSNSFYNNTAPGLGQDIGTTTFQGTGLGVYEQNSGNLKLVGSEVKTFKGVTDNVCSAALNYTIYLAGSRPASPVFTAIDLGFYSDCFAPACGSFFGSYNILAGGGCCSDRDQKWQNPGSGTAANIDLTNNVPGIYTLEIYYSYTGQDGGSGCTTTKYDNNNNNPTNYTAGFTITIPIPVSFGNINVTNNHSYNTIYWNTYSESETSVFKLERSENGVDFHTISEIPAAGFSSTIKSYTARDLNPVKGINYYRVKMIESTGRSEYSAVVKASSKIQNGWYILNNPGKESVQLIGIENGDEINMFSPSGARVFYGRSTGNTFNITTKNITTGVYFIKIISNKSSSTQQIIIGH